MQQQSLLKERLNSEEIDSEWAGEILTALNKGLEREELAGIYMIDAACGSTLCQVDFSIGEGMPIEEGMQRLSLHRPWEGPTFYTVGTDGLARIFFAREGHKLPEVPEDPDSF